MRNRLWGYKLFNKSQCEKPIDLIPKSPNSTLLYPLSVYRTCLVSCVHGFSWCCRHHHQSQKRRRSKIRSSHAIDWIECLPFPYFPFTSFDGSADDEESIFSKDLFGYLSPQVIWAYCTNITVIPPASEPLNEETKKCRPIVSAASQIFVIVLRRLERQDVEYWCRRSRQPHQNHHHHLGSDNGLVNEMEWSGEGSHNRNFVIIYTLVTDFRDSLIPI